MLEITISGTSKFSTILDLDSVWHWDVTTLQAHLCVNEVQLTPYDHDTFTIVYQRRKDLRDTQRRTKSGMESFTPVPKELKIPFPVSNAFRKDNPN